MVGSGAGVLNELASWGHRGSPSRGSSRRHRVAHGPPAHGDRLLRSRRRGIRHAAQARRSSACLDPGREAWPPFGERGLHVFENLRVLGTLLVDVHVVVLLVKARTRTPVPTLGVGAGSRRAIPACLPPVAQRAIWRGADRVRCPPSGPSHPDGQGKRCQSSGVRSSIRVSARSGATSATATATSGSPATLNSNHMLSSRSTTRH